MGLGVAVCKIDMNSEILQIFLMMVDINVPVEGEQA